MAAFSELDWRRLDVTAIVSEGGLATVLETNRERCIEWLSNEGYQIDTLDCSDGVSQVAADYYYLMDWQGQFGCMPEFGKYNLDAMRDGFEFRIPPDRTGRVLELYRPDVTWEEDPRWLLAMLSIAQEHCLYHLALGERFFALLVVPDQSPLIGQEVELRGVPHPSRFKLVYNGIARRID